MNSNIRYLHNSEIDLDKWDQTIKNAVNSRVYALSWYLDILFPDWYGLIYGDYKYVMPIAPSKKMGINYALQPVYAQQHGIFPPSTPEITTQFLSWLSQKFSYFSLSFNSMNLIASELVTIEYRKNFILSLRDTHAEIILKYTSHTSRYVRKGVRDLTISTTVSLEEYIRLKTIFGKKPINEAYIKRLKLIIFHALEQGIGTIYGVYDKHNELCAAAFFLKEENRYIYLNSVSSPEGKQQRAMYAIVDSFIGNHAQQPYLLDFEGSNIEGIARFFEGFGAQPETYQHVKYNNLPWLLKILKR
jgi:hypothetical protein